MWCANDQLDLAVKAMLKNAIEESFWSKLVLPISFLRYQNTVQPQIESTFPTTCHTCWLFLWSPTTGISHHLEKVLSYLNRKNATLCPSSYWELATSALTIYSASIDSCKMSLQSKDTLVSEQNERSEMLLQQLWTFVSIESPTNGLNLLWFVGKESVAHHGTVSNNI